MAVARLSAGWMFIFWNFFYMPSVGELTVFQSPSKYSVDDYRRDIASPAPSLKARVVDLGVNAICLIHKNTPTAWLADQIANDGRIAPEHLMLDDLCRPRNQVPPDPVPPFTGGQCECQDYRVSFDTTVDGRPSGGPISFVTKGPIGTPSIKAGDPTVFGFTRGGAACPLNYFPIFSGNAAEIAAGRFKVVGFTVSTVGGVPDVCGSPPAKYPPGLPSPSDLTRTAPFAITPTLTVPVTVTIEPTVKFSPTVLAPVIVFNAGGLRVEFSLGGFTFSPAFGSPTTNNYPALSPPSAPGTSITINPAPLSVCPDVDITPIKTVVDRIEADVKECCERNSPFQALPSDRVVVQALSSGNSGSVQLPAKTFRVVLTITSDLSKLKTQSGDSSPSVYYAGWAWFECDGGVMERLPIDAAVKSFEPPARATGKFAYKMYSDYTCSVKGLRSTK